ncbi:universal stress protein [Desulfitobacterium sp. Sab5]|uniref:universal stress protein n=1 Tax=Desulfitobacterium nosdiversum TaxID=3375356 RepID=UPI003CF21275
MFKKILVPTDGSEYSRRAFVIALKMSRQFVSEVILLHVAVTPEALGYVLSKDTAVVQEQVNLSGETVLTATCKDMEIEGVKLTIIKAAGHPSSVILDEIANKDIDLIIMGCHGYGALTGSLMGSVSQKVLAKTKQPVLLVK